ncbi:MAG: glutathione S-transferase-like protein [Sphingomonas bacterium]|nr:glutathione S-transferase-like protein [Sphingomonas bacterium]
MAEVQVHTWEPNSNSGKPLFALAEKGVPFDYHYVSLTDFEQHSPEYLAINPAGTVPTMIHDGHLFTESTPMCEYVDRAFDGPSLVPADPKQRYWMRWWGRQTDINAAALSVLGWHTFLGPMARQKSPEELEKLIARIPTKERRIAWATATKATFTDEQLGNARKQLGEWIATLDARLAVSPYLAGPDYSIADTVAFANFYALPMTVPEYANKANAPHYIAWLKRIYARPATMATFNNSRSLGKRAFEIAAKLEAEGE